MESTVTVRGQTAIPVAIRKRYNIQPQTKLEWIDDGHSITVLPIPPDPIETLKGKVKGSSLRKALLRSRQKERTRGWNLCFGYVRFIFFYWKWRGLRNCWKNFENRKKSWVSNIFVFHKPYRDLLHYLARKKWGYRQRINHFGKISSPPNRELKRKDCPFRWKNQGKSPTFTCWFYHRRYCHREKCRSRSQRPGI